jgi:hypothetical protein
MNSGDKQLTFLLYLISLEYPHDTFSKPKSKKRHLMNSRPSAYLQLRKHPA